MELKYKSTDKAFNQSFYVRRENVPYLEGNWHYHEEFELIYVLQGEGVRIVGDSLSNFGPPQLVLVGPWLPHLWKNVESGQSNSSVDIIVVKFNRLINGQDIFSVPEFSEILNLLNQAGQGLLFGGKTISKVHEHLLQLPKCKGANRLIKLMLILKLLSEKNYFKVLSSPDFTLPVSVKGETRLSSIINFISENFTNHIGLEELADEVAMTPSSLCRFFKNRTNKTIFQFVNEFRTGKACQMLISGNLSVSEICFNSGFNSLTTFNRVFKNLKKISPKEYKKRYQILNEEKTFP